MSKELIALDREREDLLRRIEYLRTRLADLTQERDELRDHICPVILARYLARMGDLEVAAMEALLEVRRLRAILEDLQAEANRGQAPNYRRASARAGRRFSSYRKKIHESAEEARKAREAQAEEVPEEEGKEGFLEKLRSLYRRLVKRLHPDMNPDLPDREKALFPEVVDAYRRKDLGRLEEIESLLEGQGDQAGPSGDLEGLRALVIRLEEALEAVEGEIRTIRSSYPYTLKALLEDSALMEKRRQDLEALIERCRDQAEDLKERIREVRYG